MNWLLNIFDSIKWKIQDGIWAVQDKYALWKELKSVDKDLQTIEEIEVRSKKKKAKKKSAKKTKKSI